MFQNSEDFKQLGTLHPENRASEYYPLDQPQPLNYAKSPLTQIQMDQSAAQINRVQVGNRKDNG